MARPATQALTQFPVTWPLYRQHQKRFEIDSILRQHDAGYFTRSAGLIDEMMTDDRIAGVTDQRASALLSKPFEFRPSGKTRKAQKIATLLGGDGKDIQGLWREIASTPALREVMSWGWHLGIGLAEIAWDKSGGEWRPRLIPYHPSWIRWDWSIQRFIVQTVEDGRIVLPRPDQQPGGDGRWFIFCPWGVRAGWRRALVRSLADKYIQRKWNERDWARYCEKHGIAIAVAKVPQGGSAEDKERFFESAQNINSEGLIWAPQGAAGEASFDLDLREPTAQTWQAFQAWKTALDQDIAIRVVGQPETTSTKSGGLAGGNKVQQEVAANIMGEDAEIGPMLRQQVFAWYVEYNFTDRGLTPYSEFQVDPPIDKKSKGESQVAVGQAVSEWQLAGAAVDVDAMAEDAGIILLPLEERPPEGQGNDGQGDQGDQGGDGEPQKNADDEPAPSGSSDEAAAPSGGNEDHDHPEGAKGSGASGDAINQGAGQIDPATRKKLRAGLPFLKRTRMFQGFKVVVENDAGSIRHWRDHNGQVGQTKMLHDYGYIHGWLGEDGEGLDCYLGPDESAPDVHVVNQLKAPDFRKHDEAKVFLGFPHAAAAKEAFLAHRNDIGAFGAMTTFPLERFRAKLRRRAPTSTTRIRASSVPENAVALRARRVTAGSNRASIYLAQLEAKARRQGAKDIRPFLNSILAAAKDANDFRELKAKCLDLLKHSKGSMSLAETVHHSRILARLAGRGAILDHIS